MSAVYQPRTDLRSKLARRAARIIGKRMTAPKLERAIISFSFDDCPKSALTNAAPLLEVEGWRGTFYMAMGLCGSINHLGQHMSEDDVKAANHNGHEIADHTFDHLDGQQVSHREFLQNIDKNQNAIDALNIPLSRNFAYPYGCVSPSLKGKVAARFDLSRGVHDPVFKTANTQLDTALIPSMRMYHGQEIEDIIKTIESLQNAPQWLILFTHDVRVAPSDFGCTMQDISRIITAIKDNGVDVMPMIEAYDYIKSIGG